MSQQQPAYNANYYNQENPQYPSQYSGSSGEKGPSGPIYPQYPQPPPPYPVEPASGTAQHDMPQQPQQQSHIVTAQPTATVVMVSPKLYDYPVNLQCPHCHEHVLTKTSEENGMLTWLVCIVLFFVFCPLCWLPCCITACQDIKHTCPNCKKFIGVYKRL